MGFELYVWSYIHPERRDEQLPLIKLPGEATLKWSPAEVKCNKNSAVDSF